MPTAMGLYKRGDKGQPPVMTQCVAGRWYEVYQLPQSADNPEAQRRWRVVCVGHRELMIVDTLAEVQSLLDTPGGWCWRCHIGLDATEKSFEQHRVEQHWVHQIDAQLTADPEGIILVRKMRDVDSPTAWLRRVPESQTIDVVLLGPSGRKSVTVATLEDVFDLLAWFAPGGEDWVVRPSATTPD
jgi:hypothetical protein